MKTHVCKFIERCRVSDHPIIYRRSENGNALFLILIAVTLFGALSYAVTHSTRDGPLHMNREQQMLEASRILNFSINVKVAVQRMLLSGVRETDISFANNNVYMLGNGTYNCWNTNPNCTSTACQVFHTAGGGIVPEDFPAAGYKPPSWTNTVQNPGSVSLRVGGIADVGSSAPELMLMVDYITPEICNAINAKLGITTNYNGTSTTSEPAMTTRPGNFGGCGNPANYSNTNIFGNVATIFKGKEAFCAPSDASYPGALRYHQVLIVR